MYTDEPYPVLEPCAVQGLFCIPMVTTWTLNEGVDRFQRITHVFFSIVLYDASVPLMGFENGVVCFRFCVNKRFSFCSLVNCLIVSCIYKLLLVYDVQIVWFIHFFKRAGDWWLFPIVQFKVGSRYYTITILQYNKQWQNRISFTTSSCHVMSCHGIQVAPNCWRSGQITGQMIWLRYLNITWLQIRL